MAHANKFTYLFFFVWERILKAVQRQTRYVIRMSSCTGTHPRPPASRRLDDSIHVTVLSGTPFRPPINLNLSMRQRRAPFRARFTVNMFIGRCVSGRFGSKPASQRAYVIDCITVRLSVLLAPHPSPRSHCGCVDGLRINGMATQTRTGHHRPFSDSGVGVGVGVLSKLSARVRVSH